MTARQWYYSESGQSIGPVTEADLRHLAATGVVADSTMVWTDGLSAWRAAGTIRGLVPKQAGAPTPVPSQKATVSRSAESEQDWHYCVGTTRTGPVSEATLRELVGSGVVQSSTHLWREGMARWQAASEVPGLFPPGPAPASAPPQIPAAHQGTQNPEEFLKSVAGTISEFTGTEHVQRGHVAGLFAEVFKRHPAEAEDAVFSVGLAGTTPTLTEIQAEPPSPWVYSRLLLSAVGAFGALWWMLEKFNNPRLLPGVILVGSFAFPVAMAVFFFECNRPRNISLFTFVKLFLWGGIYALFYSLILWDITDWFGDKIGPPIAGFVEEPGKLVAVIVLASLPRYPWTLNGMCFGAAVGAGFAAFESAGYAFLAAAEGTDAMAGNIALRGMLSPFGHVVWTAVTAGAVWRVKGAAKFKFAMLADRRCLAPILVMVALHATWNSPLPAMFPFLLGYFVLGAMAWLVAIGMLLGGVREVSEAKALGRQP